MITTLAFSYLVLYLLASFLVGARTGGPEWGTRYGLMIFPLLAILAVTGVSDLLRCCAPIFHKTVILSIAMLAFAIACQSAVRGIMEIQVTKRDLTSFEHKLRTLSLPAVTDLWWMGAAIGPYFTQHELYTVRNASDVLTKWLPVARPDISRFVYVSYGEEVNLSKQGEPAVRLLSHSVLNGISFRVYEVDRDGS